MNFRLGPCDSCSKEGLSVPAKYRCPACSIVSCSLTCVVKHKQTNNCDGLRNRAAHIRKLEYNESHFMSDYTLLEETSRAVDSATRTRSCATPSYNLMLKKPGPPGGISKGRMTMLSREASKRHITLRFMPRGFTRHSRNSSHCRSIMEPDPEETNSLTKKRDRRERMLFWHLDVYFAACGGQPESKLVKVEACAEDQLIASVLQGAISALQKGRKRRRVDSSGRVANGDYYGKYLTADVNDLCLFLRNEHVLSVPSADVPPVQKKVPSQNQVDLHRYIRLDTNVNLNEALSGKSIVEFPILHVAFKNSDEETALASATSGLFEKPDADYDTSDSDSSSSSSSAGNETSSETANGVLHHVSDPTKLSGTSEVRNATILDAVQAQPKSTATSESTAQVHRATTNDEHGPVTVIPPNLSIPRRNPVESIQTNSFSEPRIPRKSLEGNVEAPLKTSPLSTAKLAASS